jgi:hypothetical protein
MLVLSSLCCNCSAYLSVLTSVCCNCSAYLSFGRRILYCKQAVYEMPCSVSLSIPPSQFMGRHFYSLPMRFLASNLSICRLFIQQHGADSDALILFNVVSCSCNYHYIVGERERESALGIRYHQSTNLHVRASGSGPKHLSVDILLLLSSDHNDTYQTIGVEEAL